MEIGTVLANSQGKSWTGDGLAGSFHDARAKANGGKGIWHGVRDPETGEQERLAALLVTLAPLTHCEIADAMGWSERQVGEIRKRYVDDKAIVVALTRRLGQGVLQKRLVKLRGSQQLNA